MNQTSTNDLNVPAFPLAIELSGQDRSLRERVGTRIGILPDDHWSRMAAVLYVGYLFVTSSGVLK